MKLKPIALAFVSVALVAGCSKFPETIQIQNSNFRGNSIKFDFYSVSDDDLKTIAAAGPAIKAKLDNSFANEQALRAEINADGQGAKVPDFDSFKASYNQNLDSQISSTKSLLETEQANLDKLLRVKTRSDEGKAKLQELTQMHDVNVQKYTEDYKSAENAIDKMMQGVDPLPYNVREIRYRAGWYTLDKPTTDCLASLKGHLNRSAEKAVAYEIFGAPVHVDTKYYCSYFEANNLSNEQAEAFKKSLNADQVNVVKQYLSALMYYRKGVEFENDQIRDINRTHSDLVAQSELLTRSDKSNINRLQRDIQSQTEQLKALLQQRSDEKASVTAYAQRYYAWFQEYLMDKAQSDLMSKFDKFSAQGDTVTTDGSQTYVVVATIDTYPRQFEIYRLPDAVKGKETAVYRTGHSDARLLYAFGRFADTHKDVIKSLVGMGSK